MQGGGALEEREKVVGNGEGDFDLTSTSTVLFSLSIDKSHVDGLSTRGSCIKHAKKKNSTVLTATSTPRKNSLPLSPRTHSCAADSPSSVSHSQTTDNTQRL